MINLNFPTLNLKETGNRIHTLRVNCGYSVEDVASFMGFSGPQAVYKWEWGKSLPTVDNLYALSKLFGVTIEKILVGNDESFSIYRKFCYKCKVGIISLRRLNYRFIFKRILACYSCIVIREEMI